MSITSSIDWSGRQVNGVILGQPAIQEDGTFLWDGSGLGDGTINDRGELISQVIGKLVAPDLAPAVVPVTIDEKDLGVEEIKVEQGEAVAVDTKGKTIDLDPLYAIVEVAIQEEVAAPVEEII